MKAWHVIVGVIVLYFGYIIVIQQPTEYSDCLKSFNDANLTDVHYTYCEETSQLIPTMSDIQKGLGDLQSLVMSVVTSPTTWILILIVLILGVAVYFWRKRNPSAHRTKDEEYRQNYMFLEAYVNPNPQLEGEKTRLYMIGSDDHTLEILPETKKNKPYTRDDFLSERGHEITWLGRKVLPRRDMEWLLIESAKNKLKEKRMNTQEEKVFLKIRIENIKHIEWMAFKPASDVDSRLIEIGRASLKKDELNINLNKGGD